MVGIAMDLMREGMIDEKTALLRIEPNKLDEAFRSSLFEQTGGHPLFTIELLRELEGRGDLVRDAEYV